MTHPAQGGKRKATYEDLLRAPQDKLAQIVDGSLIVGPRPSGEHQVAVTAMSAELHVQFGRKPRGPDAPGGWWILYEPEVHLGADVLVPDLAGWRRERMPDAPKGAFQTLAPDWVCEVLSPSTRGHDRISKMRIYAREHVGFVWLVDPSARTVEVFRLANGEWVLATVAVGSAPARLPPFEAAELDLSRWWGETPDPEESSEPAKP